MPTERGIDYILKNYELTDKSSLANKVRNVCVVLSSSRAGSSLFKYVLSKHEDIISLDGEEEPYYVLTKNGFPWTNSDAFYHINNPVLLQSLILNELGTIKNKIDANIFKQQWKNRLLIQFSEDYEEYYNIAVKIIDKHFKEDYEHINDIILDSFGTAAGYYDNKHSISFDITKNKIEEPPFVIPKYKEPFNENDLDKTLLFKTPQNAYRIGIFEQLFPNANIKYIHLTRNFASTVSGLIDGWKSDSGFFAHFMSQYGNRLYIKGNPYPDWWKFDLPPNWEEYTNKQLHEVCTNQWASAHEHVLNLCSTKKNIKFEDFLRDKNETLKKCTDYLNLSKPLIVNRALPYVMITDKPKQYKWKKRESTINKIKTQSRVISLMTELNYNINNEQEWI